MALKLGFKQKGYIAVLGGVCIHLILGCFYLWGTLNVYITSYYKKNGSNPDLTLSLAGIVMPLMDTALSTGNIFGVQLVRKFGLRNVSFVTMVLLAACCLVSGFMPSFWPFVVFYALLFGFCTGIMYLLPLLNGYEYFPNNKGLISGLTVGSFGFGSLISAFMAQAIINPNNESPSPEEGHPEGDKYFDMGVAQNALFCVKVLSAYFVGLGLIGVFLMIPFQDKNVRASRISKTGSMMRVDLLDDQGKVQQRLIQGEDLSSVEKTIDDVRINNTQKSDIEEKLLIEEKYVVLDDKGEKVEREYDIDDIDENVTLKISLKTRHFYLISIMIFFASSFGYFMANNFKNYGLKNIDDDQFLTLTGSLGSAFNGISRLLWGILFDRTSFKTTFGGLIILQIIIAATLDLVKSIKALYFIYVCLILICNGGLFVIFPPLCSKIYGMKSGTKIYGYIYYFFCLADWFQFVILILVPDNYSTLFWMYFAMSIIAFLSLFLFKEEFFKNKKKKSFLE